MSGKLDNTSKLKKAGIILAGSAVAYAFLPLWLTVVGVGAGVAYSQKNKILGFFK